MSFSNYRRPALALLMLLAFMLPYEWVLFRAGAFSLSSLELLLILTLLLTAATLWQERRPASPAPALPASAATVARLRHYWERPVLGLPAGWLLLWAAIIGISLVSAVLAPAHSFNALKATVRTASGILLAIATPQLVRQRRQLLWLFVAIVAGATLSLSLGWVELLTNYDLAVLNFFRERISSAGPFLRLTGSFSHANQAAMYLEATLPLLAALVWMALARRRPRLVAAGLLALLVYLQGSFVTYSRSSAVTIVLAILAAASWVWWHRTAGRRRVVLPWLGIVGAMGLLLVGNLLFNPVIRLRLTTEQDNEWYNLAMEVPETLTIEAGDVVTPTVTVRNEGSLVWRSYGSLPIRLGGQWQLPGEVEQLAAEPRWPLPQVVQPGETVSLETPLRAPFQPGEYRLQWDMVQEGVVWFSEKNGQQRSTTVTVEEGDQERLEALVLSGEFEAFQTVIDTPPPALPIPGRSVLWRIAAGQVLAHPLLGIGLDNFRLSYGPLLGETEWNLSVHTNSWYIETLVSFGVLGSIPYFLWLLALLWHLFRRLQRPAVTHLHLALAIALFSYYIHGVLDYFLLFNDTGLLYWLLIGLWVSLLNRERVQGAGPQYHKTLVRPTGTGRET